MSEIVKVQLPLSGSGPLLPMVYAKGRKNTVLQSLDRATRLAMGADMKAFFQAEYRPELDRWAIGERVGDRSW